MTVPQGITLGLRQHIQAEFGGATSSVRLSRYYAGAGYTPAGTVGYPTARPGAMGPHQAVSIPSSGQIKLSNFYGSRAIPPSFSLYLNGIYSGPTDADNLYFGGDIPRSIGSFQFRYADYGGQTFTVPSNFAAPYLTISSYGVYGAVGYTWHEGWYNWRWRTTYYYDYMINIGIGLYRTSDNALIGLVRETSTLVSYTGNWTFVPVPSGAIYGLAPGETYRLRYVCDFRRDSDAGYGDISYGWYNSGLPFVTVYPQ